MPVVSSSYVAEGHAQADGRVWVRETHTDSAGGVHVFDYLRGPGMDSDAIMAARISQVNDALVQAEINGVLSDGA
jgi:hypothetical protein